MSESDVFRRLVERRQKCLDHHTATVDVVSLDQVDWTDRVAEIQEMESVVAEMWNRLKMDMSPKGNLAAPLRTRRTVHEQWMVDKLGPLLFLQDWMAIMSSSSVEPPQHQ